MSPFQKKTYFPFILHPMKDYMLILFLPQYSQTSLLILIYQIYHHLNPTLTYPICHHISPSKIIYLPHIIHHLHLFHLLLEDQIETLGLSVTLIIFTIILPLLLSILSLSILHITDYNLHINALYPMSMLFLNHNSFTKQSNILSGNEP